MTSRTEKFRIINDYAIFHEATVDIFMAFLYSDRQFIRNMPIVCFKTKGKFWENFPPTLHNALQAIILTDRATLEVFATETLDDRIKCFQRKHLFSFYIN